MPSAALSAAAAAPAHPTARRHGPPSTYRLLTLAPILLLALVAPALVHLRADAPQQHPGLAMGEVAGWASHPAAAAAAQSQAQQPAQQRAQEAATGAAAHSEGPRLMPEWPMPDADVAAQWQCVRAHVAGPEFGQHRAFLAGLQPRRGILINAGGRGMLTHLVVTLKVLREVHHCSLPVQEVWHQAREMDSATLRALDRAYGPVTGTNLSALPYPAHHRQGVKLERWLAKAYSLLHAAFPEVLLLDADALPLADPQALFSSEQYVRAGALLWPDLWRGWLGPRGEGVLRMLGLTPADLPHLHGDKDTFSLGWALAGKADAFEQVATPPGGGFRWATDQLEVKAGGAKGPGWQLVGVVQHAPAPAPGEAAAAARAGGTAGLPMPAFWHRTMNKPRLGEAPWPVEALTGPMPERWAAYFLANDNPGPTKGVSWEHVAPAAALQLHQLNPEPALALPAAAAAVAGDALTSSAAAAGGQQLGAPGGWRRVPAGLTASVAVGRGRRGARLRGWRRQRRAAGAGATVAAPCPLVRWAEYTQLRLLGLPLDRNASLEAACGQGGLGAGAGGAAWLPGEPLALSGPHLEGPEGLQGGRQQQQPYAPRLPPDGTPLAALRATPEAEAARGVLRVIGAGDAALRWLQAHEAQFPVIQRGP